MNKKRLDVLVVERGLFETRQAAQTAIMDGAVLVNGQKVTKAGVNIAADAEITLKKGFQVARFVSRGGLKLEKALDEFGIDVADRVCLDIGASTGGFTDCLLQRKARRVYAVDVGYGQLDWKLRNDSRVVLLERTNARYLTARELYSGDDSWASFAVADVSFISLAKIFPAASQLLMPNNAEMVCLVKPQFEVGRQSVSKGGVVRSSEAHLAAIDSVIEAARANALKVRGLTFSPVTGPAGNIEYLIYLSNAGEDQLVDSRAVVNNAALVLWQ